MIPESIAHYRIIRKLGQGGMGEVYLALDTKLDRKVAIKVLSEHLPGDPTPRRRLLREAQAAARLDHPNICAVYDVSDADPLAFIAMQYVEGETLADRMKSRPLEVDAAVAFVSQAASGLAEAHSHGVVHRDLKPRNLMITPRGQLKILDFGLAKQIVESGQVDFEAPTVSELSAPGVVLGTVPYMSPEQLKGEPLDACTDIFSLGVIFYEMLAGEHPFHDQSTAVTISRIMMADPVPTERFQDQVPPELQSLLGRMLAKDKAERYQNAEYLLADLQQLPAKISNNDAKQNELPTQLIAAKANRRASDRSIFKRVAQHKLLAVLTVLLLGALGVGLSRWFTPHHLDSLAILPFTYSSNDPALMANSDREYLSDGLTEGMINNLSQLAALKVIAFSSVFRYRGNDLDPQAIGRKLGVSAVVVGQVKQAGDELTVDVELVDVEGNRELWGHNYPTTAAGVQSIQHQIVQKVSEKLLPNLTQADQSALSKTETQNSEAYVAYLKGRFHWNKRTEEGFKQATGFFQEATNQDPTYALAYSGLADCYTLQSDYGFIPSKDGYALARGAAMLALKNDNNLAEAHTSLASIKAVTDWDWQGAESEYQLALKLNPNYATAHHWYAAQLLLQGRLDEALREIKKAQALDPLSLGINKDFAVILLYARNYDKALEQCRKTLEIEPRFGAMFTYIAQIYELQRKYPEAISELEKAHREDPKDSEVTYGLAQAYVLSGKKDEALKIANELNQPAKENVFLPKEAAYLYSLLHDTDKAVTILQKAADDHYLPVAELKMDPRLDELRKDSRVAALLQKIGLPL